MIYNDDEFVSATKYRVIVSAAKMNVEKKKLSQHIGFFGSFQKFARHKTKKGYASLRFFTSVFADKLYRRDFWFKNHAFES